MASRVICPAGHTISPARIPFMVKDRATVAILLRRSVVSRSTLADHLTHTSKVAASEYHRPLLLVLVLASDTKANPPPVSLTVSLAKALPMDTDTDIIMARLRRNGEATIRAAVTLGRISTDRVTAVPRESHQKSENGSYQAARAETCCNLSPAPKLTAGMAVHQHPVVGKDPVANAEVSAKAIQMSCEFRWAHPQLMPQSLNGYSLLNALPLLCSLKKVSSP